MTTPGPIRNLAGRLKRRRLRTERGVAGRIDCEGRRGPAIELRRLPGAAHERNPRDSYQDRAQQQCTDRHGGDRRASSGAGDRQWALPAHWKTHARPADVAGSGEEGIDVATHPIMCCLLSPAASAPTLSVSGIAFAALYARLLAAAWKQVGPLAV